MPSAWPGAAGLALDCGGVVLSVLLGRNEGSKADPPRQRITVGLAAVAGATDSRNRGRPGDVRSAAEPIGRPLAAAIDGWVREILVKPSRAG